MATFSKELVLETAFLEKLMIFFQAVRTTLRLLSGVESHSKRLHFLLSEEPVPQTAFSEEPV